MLKIHNAMYTLTLLAPCLTLSTQSIADGVPCRAQNYLGSTPQPEYPSSIVKLGSIVYLATSRGISICDTSDPFNPTQIGSFNVWDFDTDFRGMDIAVQGSTLYVAGRESGLLAFDVSDPTTPALLGIYDPAGEIIGVQISGSTAYLTDPINGVLIVDMSDPTSPALLGSHALAGDTQDIYYAGTTAYALSTDTHLVTLDLSNPASIQQLGSFMLPSIPGAWLQDIKVSGATAYVSADQQGVIIVDVSDPTSPSLISTVDTPDSARNVFVENDIAYIADYESGIQILDVSDPSSPNLRGYVDETIAQAVNIYVDNNTAYIADRENGFQVYNVDTVGTPLLVSQDTPGNANGIAVSGTSVYIADSDSGVQIYDITDPAAPLSIGSYRPDLRTNGIASDGNLIYVATDTHGFHIVDSSDPANPTLLSELPHSVTGPVADVLLEGSIAHVRTFGSNGSFHSIDVSDPMNPTLIRTSFFTRGDFVVDGTTAYIAAGSGGLNIIDISNAGWDVFLGSYVLPDPDHRVSGVALNGNIAYISYRHANSYNDSGMLTLDISNPSTPIPLGSLGLKGDAFHATSVGSLIYIAYNGSHFNKNTQEQVWDGGVHIIDASDPMSPVLIGTWDKAGDINRKIISGSAAYIANGEFGFQLIDVSDCSMTPCPADFTQEGDLNFLDISAFLSAYSMQDTAADFNDDGSFNFLDISEFLSAFANGCP